VAIEVEAQILSIENQPGDSHRLDNAGIPRPSLQVVELATELHH